MKRILPVDSALLVIDVQAAFFRATPPPLEGNAVIERINELIAGARRAGLPVFLIQHENDQEGPTALSPEWQLDLRLRVEPGDRRIRKTTGDAFYGTTLEADLGAARISTLVVTGYATEFCLDSTVRSALSKEFKVVVVSDTHTTHDSPVLGARRIRDFHNWVWANCTAPQSVEIVAATDISFPEAAKASL